MKKGYNPHECVLVYDIKTKQASIQVNIWENGFNLIEVTAMYNNELFVAIMEFLNSKQFSKYKNDLKMFSQKTDTMLLSEYLNEHIQETYRGPELEVFVMQLDMPLREY